MSWKTVCTDSPCAVESTLGKQVDGVVVTHRASKLDKPNGKDLLPQL